MGKMKDQLPDFEVRYETDQPVTRYVDEVYIWAVEAALRDTQQKHDEGMPTYMKRVQYCALLILDTVRKLQDTIDATDDNGDLD